MTKSVLERKRQKMENAVTQRKKDLGGWDLDRRKLVNMFATFAMLGFVTGTGVQYQQFSYTVGDALPINSKVSNETDTYNTYNYTIHHVPDGQGLMEGDTIGSNIVGEEQEFYVQKGMPLWKTEETCNHELMHDKGLGSEDHDFIDRNEDDVSSKVCSSFVKMVKQND